MINFNVLTARKACEIRFRLRLLAQIYFRILLMRRLIYCICCVRVCGMHAAVMCLRATIIWYEHNAHFHFHTVAAIIRLWIIIAINFNKLPAFIYSSGVCFRIDEWRACALKVFTMSTRCLCTVLASSGIILRPPRLMKVQKYFRDDCTYLFVSLLCSETIIIRLNIK